MAASKTLSLTTQGTGMHFGGTTVDGPMTDTVATPIQVRSSLTLGTSFGSGIAVPAGATHLILTMDAGNAIDITSAGVNTDTGTNHGSGWTWMKIAVKGGTQANYYIKSASGTPIVYYEFN